MLSITRGGWLYNVEAAVDIILAVALYLIATNKQVVANMANLLGFGQDMAANLPAATRAAVITIVKIVAILIVVLSLIVLVALPD